jgi:hypothetical protein
METVTMGTYRRRATMGLSGAMATAACNGSQATGVSWVPGCEVNVRLRFWTLIGGTGSDAGGLGVENMLPRDAAAPLRTRIDRLDGASVVDVD